ncbi:protein STRICTOSIDINE SYNTHASE-LIKE 11-like [Mercurialis annua]|uniref:protein STRICTOSIDINE SYNTHASE-LIKE 11-like n=1 Tax=Mercurialis annua TaxID=3986 RepID=UPI0024ADD406|nr:protein STRICTOSIDINE SYNTHASE-LIKE 11-like [Mercurialis annua]
MIQQEGAAGVAVSGDGSYLLYTEFIAQRIQKYWLKGPKANTSEVLLTLPGRPDNIKRAPSGHDFWIAVNVPQSPTQNNVLIAVKINGLGKLLRNISLSQDYNSTMITEVHEYVAGSLYISSKETNFIGVVRNI